MRSKWIRLGWLIVGVVSPAVFAVAATPAGTLVTNTVQVDWESSGVSQATLSAQASLVVAQLLKPALAWQDSMDVPTPVGANGVLKFELKNDGNGTDELRLSLTAGVPAAPAFQADNCVIYPDANGDGVLTPADTAYSQGVNDPQLAAGASMVVFVVCRVPVYHPDNSPVELGARGEQVLRADSTTLTGANQALVVNLPDPVTHIVHATFAVTDAAAGTAQANGFYVAQAQSFDFPLAQDVHDVNGGAEVKPGSTVTYTLQVTPKGDSVAYAVVVTDPIPANTTYKPGTLTLNGVSLTDADGDDAGHFDAIGNRIEVKLGDVAPTAPTAVITLDVIIN